MGPLIYKQRPAMPGLIFSAIVLISGGGIAHWLQGRAKVGEAPDSAPVFVLSIALALAGCGLVAAFARYQFTHLWKKRKHPPPPDEAVLKKNSRGRW
ncbi:hypothetical protein P4C99_09265 [Pontiellaceae bacterium B1224]|nr:hypothetical protein [Pontiellaceae bacterium B1224]